MVSTVDGGAGSAAVEPLLGQSMCWLLTRVTDVYIAEVAAALRELRISPRAHQVLVAAHGASHTQTELARTVGLDKTTMVVTVDELEAAGLAERRSSPTDRRARVIAVTDAGEAKIREGQAIADRVQAEVLATLPARERDVFLDVLRRLAGGRLAEPAVGSKPARRRMPRG